MSLLDIAKKRYSVRKYEDKPVEKEKLEKILACAHVAPTAANLQPVKLLVVQDKERLKSIAKAGNIYNAPLAIIVCADHSKAWTRPFDNKQTTDIDGASTLARNKNYYKPQKCGLFYVKFYLFLCCTELYFIFICDIMRYETQL